VTDPTRAGLLEIATPQLYRRNAFRITGLPTDADRRTVRQRQQKVNTMLGVGADIDLGHDLPVDPEDVARAFDLILGDPRRRLVDELFWLWDTKDATCSCAITLHRDHDAAVLAHSAALDRETEGENLTDEDLDELEKLWSESARLWGRALRRAAFWDHVRHRITVLDDKQLDESVIDQLRDEMPITLVKPLIQLAAASGSEQGWLADQARAWPLPEGTVNDLLEQAAEPMYEAVRTGLMEAVEPLNAGKPRDTAASVYSVVMPRLQTLNALVPYGRHRRTASTRNDVAVVLNNCATMLLEEIGPLAKDPAGRWLKSARDLASDPQTIAMVEQNTATLDEIVTAFEAIKARVEEFVSFGRKDLARQMLRNLRRQLAGAPGASEIDRMLVDLGDHVPASQRDPDYYRRKYERKRERQMRRYYRWGRVGAFLGALVRAVPALIFWGLIAFGIYWLFFTGDDDPTPVSVFSSSLAANAPVGTCIETKEGWQGDKGQVPSVPCDQDHWGEVLGYVELSGSGSTYPGDEAIKQTARFDCRWEQGKQTQQSDYTVDFVYPDKNRWNAGDNYVACVIHRSDDQLLPEENLVEAGRAATDSSVQMDMFSRDIAENPPAGSCVSQERSYTENRHSVSFTSCDRPHWGEIIGYPVLYEVGAPWPGNDAVYAAANGACLKMSVDRGLDGAYHYNITWPGQDAWTNAPENRKYAVCTISKADGTPLTSRLK
jgi:hypothetical protein